jgi:hypothetical protein
MKLPRFGKFCFLLFSMAPICAIAGDVNIGVISKRHCDPNSDNFNDHVYSDPKSPISEKQCVFTYLRKSKDGADFEYESEALMNINGALVYLHRKHGADEFESDGGAVSAVLNVQETGTTCIEGEDKCCGSGYSGTLTVRTVNGKASVRVTYYRGG